ncbi:helix-turn-helix transcriptional regulator [Streptomyces sp. NRRL S-646]|uniref:helix-turn-helix transcriptional regulator n=1 Tax=Streptomyces sp. NRRL S-646 TaxID=1463917 RepID=UPI0007C5B836|nr:LuxR family transcriptional regulator [Streptomyces sp. NRRL S-646]
MGTSWGGTLVGRSSEAARVRGFVSSPGDGGQVLVVTGEPGIGKSALIDSEVDGLRDTGVRVLRAEGSESERALAFAGLHQLLRPVLAQAESLPDRQRDALLGAFGIAAGSAESDQLILRIAVLTLLSHTARRHPVLIVVDDAQWLDQDSLDVLAFVSRRLDGEQIRLLGAVRSGAPLPAFARSHPVLELGPLEASAAGRLLDAQPGPPVGPLRARVLDEAAGNPLALIEFAKLESGPGLWPVEPLPLTDRLEQGFTSRLDGLPGATKRALLLAATGTGTVEGIAPEVWRPAEQAELIRLRGGDVRFRHPLIRSAVYHAAPPAERHEAHRRWAAALRDVPGRRAWHLAAAGTGPDEAVAREMECAAEQTGKRSGFAAAALAFQRAAELSPDEPDRVRRFTRAAAMAALTGQATWAEDLTAQVEALTDDPVQLALIRLHKGQALALTPRRNAAYTLLLRVAETLAPHHPAQALEALAAAALVCYYSGDAGRRDEIRRVYSLIAASPGRRQEHELACLWIRAATDPSADRAGLLAVLRRLAAFEPAGPGLLAAAATIAWLLDETTVAVHLFERMSGPALTPAPLPDGLRCVEGWVCLEHGRWSTARAVAAASTRAAALSDPPFTAAAPRALDACVLALQGDPAAARASAREALDLAAAQENRFVAVRARWAMGTAAAAEGDHDAAFDQFRLMFTTDGDEVHYHVSRYGLADLAAAAARTGRQDAARAVVDRLADRLTNSSSRHRALLFRARALLADADEAEQCFRAALDEPYAEDRPFAHAHTQLDYGEWLRRRLRSGQARPLLAAALETFGRLGAEPWTSRALAELRAAGIRQSPGVSDSLPALTPQQQEIVRLAARGLTNREIGERLQLSPRTVGSHLYRSFPKLGVTARSQLRDLVDGRMPQVAELTQVEAGAGREGRDGPYEHTG